MISPKLPPFARSPRQTERLPFARCLAFDSIQATGTGEPKGEGGGDGWVGWRGKVSTNFLGWGFFGFHSETTKH